ncbi:PIN domain-containing protein [Aquipuribacter hungaricus]|uniref:PIN domain-containing protein n=1 Tax=Aquipuribacter hungaricus TaxID=545624 RepID=A0ABV7WE77_9MICO
MAKLVVVLDTNVLKEDPVLNGPAVKRLFALSRRQMLHVAIPEVVLLELRRQYTDVVEGKVAQLRGMPYKAKEALAELRIPLDHEEVKLPSFPDLDLAAMMESYSDTVTLRLSEAGVSRLSLPRVSHADVLRRDLERRSPFKANGRGYRDTLIWESIRELFTEALALVFITRDGDFVAGGSLKDDLSPDVPGYVQVTCAEDIDSALALATIQDLVSSVEADYAESFASAEDIAVAFLESAVEQLQDVDVPEDVLRSQGIDRSVYDATIEAAEGLHAVIWSPYDEFDGTTVLGEASLLIAATAVGYVDKADSAALADEDLAVVSWDTEDRAQVQFQVRARAEFDLRIEVSGESVEDWTFGGLSPE